MRRTFITVRRKGFSKSLQRRKSRLSAERDGLFIFVYVVVCTMEKISISCFLPFDRCRPERKTRFKPPGIRHRLTVAFGAAEDVFSLRKMPDVKIKNPKHIDASKTHCVRMPVRSLFR